MLPESRPTGLETIVNRNNIQYSTVICLCLDPAWGKRCTRAGINLGGRCAARPARGARCRFIFSPATGRADVVSVHRSPSLIHCESIDNQSQSDMCTATTFTQIETARWTARNEPLHKPNDGLEPRRTSSIRHGSKHDRPTEQERLHAC